MFVFLKLSLSVDQLSDDGQRAARHKKDDDVVDSADGVLHKKTLVDRFFTYNWSLSSWNILFRRIVNVLLFVWLTWLSYPVVMNLLAPNQGMNISFHSFRIMNSYGAFGSVTKVRHEVRFQAFVWFLTVRVP
jgi:hypothetical protein